MGDYPNTDNKLTCTIDADNMQQLAQQCGIKNLQVLTDRQQPLTKGMAYSAIQDIVSGCSEGDAFVFYYSGHGTQLGDADGAPDDDDEQDDAYCFQDEGGKITYESCWSDDDFAQQLTDVIPDGVDFLILSDCCHSDTIADFSKPLWRNKKAVSISGCLDSQTSGDIGKGGIFTHSMLLAIDKLSQAENQGVVDEPDYSVGYLYNVTLRQKQKFFKSASQQISIEHSRSCPNDAMCWPLIPQGVYTAPLNKGASRSISYGAPSGGNVPPAVLEACSNPTGCGALEDDDLDVD